MSEHRLTALASYQQLPPKLRSVVKLALLHRIPGPQAVARLNLPNPTRTWESDRIQAVVAAYGDPDAGEDWVARLEAVKDIDQDSQPKPLPFSQQPEPHTVDTFQKPESPRFDMSDRPAEHGPGLPGNCPTPAQDGNPEGRCLGCGLILCGCIGREAAALIEERRRDPDKAAIDHNRAFVAEMFQVIERDGTDEDERDRLVTQYMRQRNHF